MVYSVADYEQLEELRQERLVFVINEGLTDFSVKYCRVT
jgi:hypothetical protein